MLLAELRTRPLEAKRVTAELEQETSRVGHF